MKKIMLTVVSQNGLDVTVAQVVELLTTNPTQTTDRALETFLAVLP